MKTIDINGITFKRVNRGTKNGESIYQVGLSKCNTWYYYEDIYKAYGRPSQKKINEWHKWSKWFEGIKGTNKEIWIPSRNTWQFTIAFKFITPTGFRVVGYITKTRNEVVIYG